MEVRLSHSVKTCSPTCVNVSGSVREVIITVCPDLATHSTNIFLSLRLFPIVFYLFTTTVYEMIQVNNLNEIEITFQMRTSEFDTTIYSPSNFYHVINVIELILDRL